MFDLPKKCFVNKFIPKKTFYERVGFSSNIKDDFVNIIDKIIWLYKISPDTLGVNKTKQVEEIEIFELYLKIRVLPKTVIKIISKSIPYPVLFVIKYKDEVCYSIKADDNFFTDWNEQINFNFKGINLEYIYEQIVKIIIREEKNNNNFSEILIQKSKREELLKQIQMLKKKIKTEKQFNKKVELNKLLGNLEKEMGELLNG